MTTAVVDSPNPLALWFHEYIAQPYHEGIRRIERAVFCADLSYIDHPDLSLKDAVVSFLVGVALILLPFINTIIWIAMRTFGGADVLAPPFSGSTPPSLPQIPAPPKKEVFKISFPRLEAIPSSKPKPLEIKRFRYKDFPKGKLKEFDWTHRIYPHKSILIERESSNQKIRSKAVFDPQGNQIFFKREEKEKTFRVEKKGDVLIAVKTTPDKEHPPKTFPLKKDLPWIQTLTFAFTPFVRSCAEEHRLHQERSEKQPFKKEFRFYTIHPSKEELREVSLTFQESCHLEGHGQVLRFESAFCDGFVGSLQQLFKLQASHWFYPDGRMAKMKFPDFVGVTSEFVPISPLPESERP